MWDWTSWDALALVLIRCVSLSMHSDLLPLGLDRSPLHFGNAVQTFCCWTRSLAALVHSTALPSASINLPRHPQEAGYWLDMRFAVVKPQLAMSDLGQGSCLGHPIYQMAGTRKIENY